MRAARNWLGVLAAVSMLAGCALAPVPMNQKLTAAAPTANRDYSPALMNQRDGRADTLILVSFSGGGKRSAAFGHGVLRGMRDLPVRFGGPDSTLLHEVDVLSGVSGGSFPAAHYALNGTRSFESFPDEFLYQDINAYIAGAYLLPWHWGGLANPLYGSNDRMAEVYDKLMFHGATYADLRRQGRPVVSINATDIAFGLPFGFTPLAFDLLCSDLGKYPVARAVAASNGFPVLFTPITLQNFRSPDCALPPPTRPNIEQARQDYRTRQIAETMDRYLEQKRTPWVHLMDGGISDNLAMRASLNTISILLQQSQSYTELIRPIRRLLIVSVDGQSAADPAISQERTVNGLTQIFGAVTGTQIDNYNVETLMLAESELAALVKRIREVRCDSATVIDGFQCGDVQGALVRISLSEFQDAAERARLLQIPTGLTIKREYVDMLVQAGETMAKQSEDLRRFLDNPGPSIAPEPRQRLSRR